MVVFECGAHHRQWVPQHAAVKGAQDASIAALVGAVFHIDVHIASDAVDKFLLRS